ncbi:MAG: acyltransferase [Candidatus Electrothrix aestuarii]|uniref:Acyltransferase n=1 Tax=Candidatus Electrothrix aestuarii TaxID=3062594 RepID=A0AAU8LY25_9BACT|nr:acyltransferase [Candidatus Electrothrix aestuarii]
MRLKEFRIHRVVRFLRRLKLLLAEMYYTPDGQYRKKTVDFKCSVIRAAKSYGSNLKVNGKTTVTNNTVLGNNVNFNGMSITGRGRVEIGDNFHSGPDCLIISQIHNYDDGQAVPYDATYLSKPVLIKDNVWIGSRVIILGEVTIGEGAIIQAGSVVCRDIPDFAVAGGHPAKVFKYRDIEHYMVLKKAGKFH